MDTVTLLLLMLLVSLCWSFNVEDLKDIEELILDEDIDRQLTVVNLLQHVPVFIITFVASLFISLISQNQSLQTTSQCPFSQPNEELYQGKENVHRRKPSRLF